jgi:hypothetical protein
MSIRVTLQDFCRDVEKQLSALGIKYTVCSGNAPLDANGKISNTLSSWVFGNMVPPYLIIKNADGTGGGHGGIIVQKVFWPANENGAVTDGGATAATTNGDKLNIYRNDGSVCMADVDQWLKELN